MRFRLTLTVFKSWRLIATVFVIALAGLSLSNQISKSTALYYSTIDLSQIHRDQGHAFKAKLSQDDMAKLATSASALYERVRAKGGPIIYAEPLLGETRVYYLISNLLDKRFPDLTAVKWRKLGPEVNSVAEVRNKGQGRYSIVENKLVFSISDNSTPINNGRIYKLRYSHPVPKYITIPLQVLALLSALILAIVTLRPMWTKLYESHRLFRNLVPGIVISAVTVIVIFAAGEAYLRVKIPFTEDNQDYYYTDPNIGSSFRPGALVRSTNHVDFWTVATVNSLGFVDREPQLPKDDDTFRIVVVGDSLVAALQVEPEEKFPVLLESLLREEFPDRHFDVVAMGVNGTGQVNQLAYLETYTEILDPDLAIILFVNNDFTDNSPTLQMIEKGVNIDRSPMLFFVPKEDGFERTEIHTDAWAHRLHLTWGETMLQRFEYARGVKEHAELLKGWNYSSKKGKSLQRIMWEIFHFEDLPPVFAQAIEITGYALDHYVSMGQQKGFKLLIVAEPNLTRIWGLRHDDDGRQRLERGAVQRVERLANERGIRFLDLFPSFTSQGELSEVRFRYDGHWNKKGHRRAAKGILEFLVENPDLLR